MQLGAGAGCPRVMLLPPTGGVWGVRKGKRWGVVVVEVGRRVFGRMWPEPYCRPLAQHHSKTKHTHTQRESAPYGTILNSKTKKKKWFQMKNKKQIVNLASIFFPLCLDKEQNFLFCFRLNKAVKLFLCLLSYLTTRLRMCTCVCRLPFLKKVTKPCQTAAPRAHLHRHCYHGNTGRDDSQPLCDGTAAWSCISLLLYYLALIPVA